MWHNRCLKTLVPETLANSLAGRAKLIRPDYQSSEKAANAAKAAKADKTAKATKVAKAANAAKGSQSKARLIISVK